MSQKIQPPQTHLQNSRRLQLYLRDNLGISRRTSENLIREKRIQINNRVAELGDRVSSTDQITFDGRLVLADTVLVPKVYLALNKPKRYLTTRNDPFNRPTIYKLLPSEYVGLFPVGRLDFNTEGLILLTNDGDLTLRLTHPRYQVEKEYRVELDKGFDRNLINLCAAGLSNKEITTGPIYITTTHSPNILDVVISEGQNREVRRIFKSVGYKVIFLKRTRISKLKLSELNIKVGEYKILGKLELSKVV